MTEIILICGPDESGDLDARCTCGHTKREHLRPSCPCWYFSLPKED